MTPMQRGGGAGFLVLVLGGCGRRDARDDVPIAATAPSASSPLATTTTGPDSSTPASTDAPTTEAPPAPTSPAREERTYTVDGVARSAIIRAPATSPSDGGAPLVLVFHGHGGTAANAERKYDIPSLWPEAVVAYLDGIPGTPGRTDPAGALNGWQKNPGESGDRDLHFYDVVLADLEVRFPIDRDRVYVYGHSNGARFADVLWNQRGDGIAAVASSSAQGGTLINDAPPRSLFMSMGEADPIVPYAGQKLSIPLAEARLRIDQTTVTHDGYLTRASGEGGLELDTYIHPGGHEMPDEVLPLIVTFFQRNRRP
jgi:polyhydroxybutyrate depolymerase